MYQIYVVVVFLLNFALFDHFFGVSSLYHMIRGQNLLKLQIFFNVCEMLEKLLSSLEIDVQEVLIWKFADPKAAAEKESFVWSFVIVAFQAVLQLVHTFVDAVLITTLNAATNSFKNALIPLMMSNAPAELKSGTFKRFDIENVFQMSCGDSVERFQLTYFILIVFLHNLTTSGDTWTNVLSSTVSSMATIYGMEILTDWIKHLFVSKFNNLPGDARRKYRTMLAFDFFNTQSIGRRDAADPKKLHLSPCRVNAGHFEVKRIGFVCSPLLINLLHAIVSLLRSKYEFGTTMVSVFERPVPVYKWMLSPSSWGVVGAVVGGLVALRLVVHTGLRVYSALRLRQEKDVNGVVRLLGETYRYEMFKGRIPG